MDKESDLMNQEPDEIREQIEETRSALTEKLETLEHGVKETVHEAKAAVTDTIENVKETVKGTVETVKDTLDIRGYVQEHPWPMFAGSVAFGWALGHMFRSSNGDKISQMASNGTPMETNNRFTEEVAAPKNGRPEDRHKGVLGSVIEKLRPEINELEGIAIGAVGALVRDLIKQAAAEPLGHRLEDVANRVTAKLGGQVIQEPLLANSAHE